ncbi:MAG: hypothetical protein SOY07_03470 [Bacteroidales bacterium]|nr:hypothetical protein [Bacteroidales bacterium]
MDRKGRVSENGLKGVRRMFEWCSNGIRMEFKKGGEQNVYGKREIPRRAKSLPGDTFGLNCFWKISAF